SNDIFYVETNKDTLLIHTNNQTYESKNRLYELEKILPPKFIRISKSTILNLEKVSMYSPLLNGLMEAKLINSETAYISRKYLKEVRNRIKGGL
ncbi:LytTR family transcriptional regulator, partial [Clostridium perfringens]|nr:LytTR family transcriptional regulator [Clostridium perfringens]